MYLEAHQNSQQVFINSDFPLDSKKQASFLHSLLITQSEVVEEGSNSVFLVNVEGRFLHKDIV